jgi:hypothetical protein
MRLARVTAFLHFRLYSGTEADFYKPENIALRSSLLRISLKYSTKIGSCRSPLEEIPPE